MGYTKEEVSRIWLSYADLPSAKIKAIMDTYGSALSFFQAFDGKMWDILPSYAYERLKELYDKERLSQKLNLIRQSGISVILTQELPESIQNMIDPPLALYYIGDISLLAYERMIAIVGTRKPSNYGSEMARIIAKGLGENGVVVVNGFARGIDSYALEGCLDGGGKVVAFMGCGLDKVYPPENAQLFNEIVQKGGLVVSEYPPEVGVQKAHFPQRNRMMSAVVSGVMLIEGAFTGGGMITVNHALEQGKDVFVLPGPSNSSLYEAPHQLIRDGARLATSAGDILADMGWDEVPIMPEHEDIMLEEGQVQIAELLDKDDLSFEELAQRTNQRPGELNSNLTILELAGIIKKSAGRIFMKVKR